MSYIFEFEGEQFTGQTVPGSARVHIYHSQKNQFVAAFEPERPSLFSDRASGSWSAIAPNTSICFLEKIQPHVLELCKKRILSFHS